jgi:hypothetical protein
MSGNVEAQTKVDLDFAWKMFCELRLAQNHFNDIKVKCRSMASTWLLAAFAGIGFLLSTKLSINIPTEVVVLGIAIAASTGLVLLWILDMLVYHRLLDACFQEALNLEAQFRSLPQVHHNMVSSQPGGQVVGYAVWFYIITISAPLVFGGAVFSYWCFSLSSWAGALSALIIGSLVVAVGRVVRIKSPNPALQPTGPAAPGPARQTDLAGRPGG